MKKIFFALLALCFIAVSSLTSFAQGEIAKLDVNYTVNENGNVVVTASVFDIQEPSGILMLFYNVQFDDSKLEVVNSNVNMPPKWEPFADDGMSEVIFMYNELSDNYVWWSTYAGFSGEGYGITEDNEFRIEIELKPLENCETKIRFVCESAYGDEDVYMENPLKAESKSISVKVEASNNPVDESNLYSDEIQSSEFVEESEEASDSSSEAVLEESSVIVSEIESEDSVDTQNSEDANASKEEISDASDITAETSIENSSDETSDNSFGTSSEITSESIEDSPTSDDSKNESEQNGSYENSAEGTIGSQSSDNDEVDDEDTDGNNILIIIISVIVVAILSVGTFFIIKSKRGEK